ncbi:MAG: hypothetical protein EOM26_03380 [Alphaproteobacteria bacterium]|nr:hypothetical protein [Alphaproteobacteria bacterium]
MHSDNRHCDFALNLDNDPHRLLEKLSETHPVYWLHQDICDGEQCFASRNSVFLYRDYGHLSEEGSALLGGTNDWFEAFHSQALLYQN